MRQLCVDFLLQMLTVQKVCCSFWFQQLTSSGRLPSGLVDLYGDIDNEDSSSEDEHLADEDHVNESDEYFSDEQDFTDEEKRPRQGR